MAEPETREPVLWDCNDTVERLIHSDEDDAVEYVLDGYLHPKMTHEEVLAALPETLEVHGFARHPGPSKQEKQSWASGLLERLLEWVDDEYGDPDEGTTPTDMMEHAAQLLVDEVLRDYVVWRCEKVCTKTIDVKQWVEENRPDWLEDDTK